MTSISKNAYIDKLEGVSDKYNNTYYRIMNMKPIGFKISTYSDFDIENNDKDSKSRVGDYAITSKYKNFFQMLQSRLVWRKFSD